MRLTQALCAMIYEIEAGTREFGFDNLVELESYTRFIGRALPWSEENNQTGVRAAS